jgi:hypothetical protein
MLVPSVLERENAIANALPRAYLPWVWVYLREFFLVDGYGLAIFVEDEEAGARGALVDAANEDLV